MWNCFVTALFVVALLSCHTGAEPVLLNDDWRLQSAAQLSTPDGAILSQPGCDTRGWYPVTIPTTVLAALVDNEVYPDPYYGNNLKEIPGYQNGRWLRMDQDSPFYPAWWYRREFAAPEAYAGKRLRLHLDGINYRANVWLNGEKIAGDGEIIGMFRRFELDVTEKVFFDRKNVLAVEVSGPGKLPKKRYRTKQVEATTGWDDHNPQPPDLNMGIWRNVYLTASGPVLLRHPYVGADLPLPALDSADLTVQAQIVNLTDDRITVQLGGVIEDRTFSREIALRGNESRWIHFTPAQFPQLTVKNPRLWWPNPLGPQEMYHLDMTVSVAGEVSDQAGTDFGIRAVSTYINDEGWRGYMVNGKKVLIRGGAWMTNDMLLRLSTKRDTALVRYAREANLNMLRSEGFSIRETDRFYTICDELGVMVTQQLFGRSIPAEDLAIDCVRDSILRIRNHPSLVHFLGHDETFPTDKLDEAYRGIMAKYTPQRSYQPHSGAFEIENRFDTGGTRTGTRELWTYADPTRYYNSDFKQYAWGFAQSGGIGGIVAQVGSVRRMVPEKDLWPLWSAAMSFHTVIQGGGYFAETLNALNQRYGEPTNIDDFCMTAQVMNYESARAMYESYARNKYGALGITTWKYDAAWPAVMTWQYVDYYLVPTGAYHGAKKACEALHVQYSYDDDSVWVTSSLYQSFDGLRVTAKVYNLDMKEQWAAKAVVSVGPDGKTQALVVDWPEGLSTTHFLALTLADSAGEVITDNLYWLSTTPDIPGNMLDNGPFFKINAKSIADLTALRALPDVSLHATKRVARQGADTVVTVTVENPTEQLAFFINLGILPGAGGHEVGPCYWEENDFSLFPGAKKTVTATFATADLDGKEPQLRVSGWNVKAK